MEIETIPFILVLYDIKNKSNIGFKIGAMAVV